MGEDDPRPRWESVSRDISPMARDDQLEPFPELETTIPIAEPRTSAAEPAGSGMPPLETAYTTEKEAVGGPKPGTPHGDSIRTTFLEVPPSTGGQGTARPVQSPLTEGTERPLSSIDASSDVEYPRDTVKPDESARFRSSFSSSAASSALDSHADAEDGANVIYQAARQARLKRPSLLSNPADAGSNVQLARLAKFIKGRELQAVDTGEFSGTQEQDGDAEAAIDHPFSFGFDKQPESDLVVDEERRIVNLPKKMKNIDRIELVSPTEPMSLADALSVNPVDMDGIPKRSMTLPSSLGSPRRTRFAPLSIDGTAAGRFRRDSIVTTPYPKLSQTGSKDEKPRGRSGSRSPKAVEFSLTISARNRNSTVSVPRFGTPEPKVTAWWNTKEMDDKKLVEMAKAEYASIQGSLRHFCGAKTAKAVHVRFVRENKSEPFREPDSPLIGGRWSSYAESNFWSLWVNPSQGQAKRDWLDALTNHSTIYGASRTFVLEIIETYDATRIIIAFLAVTLLSMLAMFLWLFVGVGENGGTGGGVGASIDDSGTLHVVEGAIKQTAGSPAAAFMFGIWVLTLGWTGVGAWMLVS